jgi:hypothetical protein
MMRIAAFIALALFAAGATLLLPQTHAVKPAHAQFDGPILQAPAAAPSYTGPLDGLSHAAAAAWGLRRLTNTYSATGYAAELYCASCSPTSENFSFDGSGNFDTASVATWLGANTGYCEELYDQIGSNNLVQATAANMPKYIASALNSKAACQLEMSANACMISANSTTTANGQNAAYFMVVEYGDQNGAETLLIRNDSNAWVFNVGDPTSVDYGMYDNANGSYYSTGFNATGSSGRFFGGITSSGTFTPYRDGTSTGGTARTGVNGSGSGTIGLGQVGSACSAGSGNDIVYLPEVYLWNVALTSGDVTAMHSNVSTYFGTP